jgi:hypothetical protein
MLVGTFNAELGQGPLELVGLRDVTPATGAGQHLADIYLSIGH